MLTASVILRNALHIMGGAIDIRANQDVAELCDQYCLAICLDWLGTRYGFPLYGAAIDPASGQGGNRLSAWPALSNQYPFYAFSGQDAEKNLWREPFQYLEDNFAVALDLTGEIYEQTLSAPLLLDGKYRPYIRRDGKRRTGGEFYTPAFVVAYCLEKAVSKEMFHLISEVEGKAEPAAPAAEPGAGIFKMLDPACGTGNFLVGALALLKERGLPDSSLLSFLERSVYGRDTDGRAVCLARISLILCMADQLSALEKSEGASSLASLLQRLLSALEDNVQVSDSLIDRRGFGRFHLVVGNPPYISYGARNQRQLPSNWSSFLRSAFPDSAQYKIRLTSIFQEIALEAARPGGQIVLLLPDAFLTGSYYVKLRRRLAAGSAIISLSELPESIFATATVGRWCVAHYEKNRQDGDCLKGQVREVELCRWLDSSGNERLDYRLPVKSLITADKCRFQLVFSDLDLKIVESLKELSPLRTILRGHTGIRSRSGQASIVSRQKLGPAWKPGLTSGSEVGCLSVAWAGGWLNTAAEGLFAGGHDCRLVEKPKILVRQTADRLIAAIDEEGLYHLNNVHSFAAVPSAAGNEPDLLDLEFLAGLLNSNFWLYLYRLKSREHGRVLAQIDIEMVEAMPLPPFALQPQKMIAHLVRQQIDIYRREKGDRGKQAQPGSVTAFQAQRAVDRLVYELYGLSEGEIAHIEQVSADARRKAKAKDKDKDRDKQEGSEVAESWSSSLPGSQQVYKLLEFSGLEPCLPLSTGKLKRHE